MDSIFSEQFMDTAQSGARVKSITNTWSPDDTQTHTLYVLIIKVKRLNLYFKNSLKLFSIILVATG